MKGSFLGGDSNGSMPVEITDETGLTQLFNEARAHLETYPEDGILMLADYESFARDLGFIFSPAMLAHVRKAVRRDVAKSPKAQAAYAKLKAAGSNDKFQFAARLARPDDVEKKIVPWQPKHMAMPNDAPVLPEQSSGFGVLLQVSEKFCNDILDLLFSSSLIRPRWTGRTLAQVPDLFVNLVADYDVRLTRPELSFLESTKPDEAALVRLSIAAVAKLAITAEFLPLSGASLPVDRERFEVEVGLGIVIETRLDVSPPNPNGQSAVVVDLTKIRDLNLTVNGHGLDPLLLGFLNELLNRLVRTELEFEKKIAISQEFDSTSYGGQKLRSIGLRTLVASGNRPASLSIGLDFDGAGSEASLRTLIPSGEDYAFIVRRPVFDAIWQSKKNQIKSPGDVRIKNPRLVLMDGFIAFSIEAEYEVFDVGNCGWFSWTVEASGRAAFAFESFQKDGIYYVRPKLISGPDIDMDDWDEFVLSVLVGFLLSIIGVSWGAGSVVAYIVIEAMIGDIEKDVANKIGGYSIGLRGEVPGTSIVAMSTTPLAPMIFRTGITAHGGIAFDSK